jgi:hypothetical protein
MTLRLNGSSSGFTEIDAPAAAGSNTFVLPTSNGSAEQFLKNSGTAGTLEFSSMVETSTGVGIGTTSPQTKLHTSGTTNGAQATFGGSNSGLKISTFQKTDNDAGVTLDAQQSSNGTLTFATKGSERMRIDSTGNLLVLKTAENLSTAGFQVRADAPGLTQITRDGSSVLHVNRLSSDGVLVSIRQADTEEGTISVSGSTVSYNGGHLARWSQLAGGAERTEILRGSVLSNLDEMCEWAYEAQDAVLYTEEDELPEGVSIGDVKTPAVAAGTEDNEQLNRMKVSDVEGDVNVSGVFQAWDDDDDTYTNDFYCAMTGDFVIRIAQGVTVQRGNLLMSAGDGTAKPQGDGFVQDKTIAKVTSTTVSTTYSDGSYCVPCVLMAC